MTKERYCINCRHASITTSSDCYATVKPSKLIKDYVTGGTVGTGLKGVVSCYTRNKNGNCRHFERK